MEIFCFSLEKPCSDIFSKFNPFDKDPLTRYADNGYLLLAQSIDFPRKLTSLMPTLYCQKYAEIDLSFLEGKKKTLS